MATQKVKMLLSALPAGEFFGRKRDFDELMLHAWSTSGLRLLSPPWGGASELLKQVSDSLFFDSSEIIPFYFAFRASDGSARNAATRLLQEFLLQMIAYRRRDPAIYVSSPEVCELSDLTSANDSEWFDKLVKKCDLESEAKDDRSFIRSCLSAPFRVAASGTRIFVMLDDIHETAGLEGATTLLSQLADVFSRPVAAFVIAGRRRFSVVPGFPLSTLEINDLDSPDSGDLIVQLANRAGVPITDQTRDLIATQIGGRVGFAKALIASARDSRGRLETFQQVERKYVDEILKGRLGGLYLGVLDQAVSSAATRRELIRLLYDGIARPGLPSSLDVWQRTLKLNPDEFRHAFEVLVAAEIVSIDGSVVQVESSNNVLADTLRSRFSIECEGQPRAVVAGELLAAALKRAPRMMAGLYRREASIGLSELLSVFDCQEVPLAMLDYGRFRSEMKGLSAEDVKERVATVTERITLPQIVHTAPAADYCSPMDATLEPERFVVAIGFNDQTYTDASQVAWLAAEIDSKVEADRETAESYCKRLKEVAQEAGFLNFRLWLIANEGFTDEALDALSSYNAIGSSRRQAIMLREELGGAAVSGIENEGVEYEMVIPVGDDTELIAAHALEEIARRHKFPSKMINQLKTALVEACINAAEHGLAPDRKIHQRFLVSDDKITISISNRGLRLTDKLAEQNEGEDQILPQEPSDTRRGWGLNLIRGLMDVVRVEPVDDGTMITMTKFMREDARV